MPSHYQQLTDTVEAQLLIGPRGIGKTTLLKMLLPEALDAWRSQEAQRARERIAFTGVFVQADKIWSGQLDQLSGPFIDGPLEAKVEQRLSANWEHWRRFARAAFAFTAFSAFARAAAYRCRPDGNRSSFRWVDLSRTREEELVAGVTSAWFAHPATSTFSGLAEQMQGNLSSLAQLMRTAATPGLPEQELAAVVRDRLLSVDFFTATVQFIDAFNHAAGEQEAPWVLLVDEFEFLPPAARFQLGDGFQGHDPRLSYKVSLAPYTGTSPFAGGRMHDWHRVELTHQSADDFTQKLFARQFANAGKPEKLLKARGFETGRKDKFAPGSRNASDINRLADHDESFRKWLSKTLAGRPLASISASDGVYNTLRKAMPLVRLRLEHRRLERESRAARAGAPAVSPLYGGTKSIYLLTEGNPRWIKALAYRLLDGYKGTGSISPSRQAEAISHVAHILYENLQAVSIQQRSGVGQDTWGIDQASGQREEWPITPYGLLTLLGEEQHRHTHEDAFSPERAGGFRIDDQDEWLGDVLNSLIFLGALVVEPKTARSKYERVRLAHMWAPIFELLLISNGPPRSIAKVLAAAPPRRRTLRGTVLVEEGRADDD